MTASLPPSPRSKLPIGVRIAILAGADLKHDRRWQLHSWDRHREICGNMPFILVLLARLMLRRNALSIRRRTPFPVKGLASLFGPSRCRSSSRSSRYGTAALVFRKYESGGRLDGPGDRQDVVLDLSISGLRQFQLRGADVVEPGFWEGRRTYPPGADNHIVVPVGKTVRIVAMGTNLIYSWAIPSIGAKITSLPGQTNQSRFNPAKEGRYYGECFELCGLPHASSPSRSRL